MFSSVHYRCNTLSDVILHVRYTARQGGENLGDQAVTEMRQVLARENQSGLALFFSLRHDFPTEWSAFVKGTGDLTLKLRKDHFPYMVDSENLVFDALELYAQDGTDLAKRTEPVPPNLEADLNGTNRASSLSIPPDAEVLKRTTDGQVFLIVRYRLNE